MRAVGLIPCRLKSTRLPSKALLMIDSLPIIVHTMKRAQLAKSLDDVYVCTDSEEIANVVHSHGGKPILTKSEHTNGTERIAEAAESLEADLFVNIQGDEPVIDPETINQIASDYRKYRGTYHIYNLIKYPNNILILTYEDLVRNPKNLDILT